MGWQHREYAQDEYNWQPRGGGSGNFLSNLSVTWRIIIVNVILAFITLSASSFGSMVERICVMQAEAVAYGQVWRLFTATYLHADANHLLFNMLGLFFFGRALEQAWGGRQFFIVYTLGGILGSVIFTIAAYSGFISTQVPLLGASGSVLTVLGAVAYLFPRAKVYIYFLFPIELRILIAIYAVWYVVNVFNQGANYGGDLVHLVGLAFGMLWAYKGWTVSRKAGPLGWVKGLFSGGRARVKQGAWERKLVERRKDEEIIDRILQKVSEEGIHSLTSRERSQLEAARRRRNQQDAAVYRDRP